MKIGKAYLKQPKIAISKLFIHHEDSALLLSSNGKVTLVPSLYVQQMQGYLIRSKLTNFLFTRVTKLMSVSHLNKEAPRICESVVLNTCCSATVQLTLIILMFLPEKITPSDPS